MDGYQLCFDDIDHVEAMALEPGRFAFIDECGGFGFDFDKPNVSSHYIVCAIIVENKNIVQIQKRIYELQATMFGKNEMKSSSIGTNHPRRAKLLTELLLLDFQIILLIADKKAFYEDSPLTEYRKSFVKFLHQKLYESMYCSYSKLKIVEDEFGDSAFQSGYKQYIIDHRPNLSIFNDYDFDYVNSKDNYMVQIADIIAGSVMQHIIDNSAPDVLKIFRSRISDIVNFPPSYQIYSPKKSDDKELDYKIYNLAVKCATDYIDEHKDTETEEIRFRVLFLRILLFNARMYSKSRYVFAGEIVQKFSESSNKPITRDYLYRRIIAPLRDDGVLIASSAHGFKIPKTVDDNSTYINQTVSVVGPMLHRIGKCRTLIKKQTDGTLDIFDDKTLMAFKRYFGDL